MLSRLTSVRRVALAMLVVMLILGGALIWAIESAAPGSPRMVTQASNERAAARDDQLLLGRLVLPADASPSPREPPGGGSTLSSHGPDSDAPHVIDQHAWWVVPRPEQAVLAFVNAHLPAGSHVESSGSGSTRGVRTGSFLLLQWPAIKSVLYRRALTVEFVPLSNGFTGVRADARDVWEVPRPASEWIPSSARVLNIYVVPDFRARPSLSITVTDTANVSKIAAMIDHLATQQIEPTKCRAGEGEGPLVIFNFRARRGGPVLAQAQRGASAEGPCEPMRLWIYKRKQTPLVGGYAVIQESEKLLHVTLH